VTELNSMNQMDVEGPAFMTAEGPNKVLYFSRGASLSGPHQLYKAVCKAP
jgi:hypothetical protein